MPIPGPRTQTGPVPGYDNPGGELPDRINLWGRPGSVGSPGRSPGMMVVSLRGCRLAAGQIRRLWRQSVDLIPAQASFSWTTNSPAPGRPVGNVGALGVTRALRYMARSVYMGAGVDNTRYEGLHTPIPKFNRHARITINSGQARSRPTTRNRVSSFGSRVTPMNPPIEGAS